MLVLICLFSILVVPFKSKCRLEAENVALRHQVMVLQRQLGRRVHLTNFDRLFLVQLYHWYPSIRRVLAVVQPETLVRWHRAGSRCYWRWKLRCQGGRIPALARACVAALGAQLRALKGQILEFDRQIMLWHRSHETSKRLDEIPGVGPALATTLVASIADPNAFRSGSCARDSTDIDASRRYQACHIVAQTRPGASARRRLRFRIF